MHMLIVACQAYKYNARPGLPAWLCNAVDWTVTACTCTSASTGLMVYIPPEIVDLAGLTMYHSLPAGHSNDSSMQGESSIAVVV